MEYPAPETHRQIRRNDYGTRLARTGRFQLFEDDWLRLVLLRDNAGKFSRGIMACKAGLPSLKLAAGVRIQRAPLDLNTAGTVSRIILMSVKKDCSRAYSTSMATRLS